ncbi:MAG: glycerophosphodiester phosphodiesterase [Clostridia bacterium]|nr:glycerophosphodiester phosphodiesterase [Clostridia bacterium]
MEEAIIVILCVLAALILLSLVYLFVIVRPRAKKCENEALLCDYAHRGLHGETVPENSLLAFDLAAKEGYGIELDVQLSADGEVMVFHDYRLARMTGCEKKLCELTAAELSGLRLKGTDEKIPTFREVLALVDGRVPLLVELKGESTDTSLCPKVAELLREYGGAYCIESFNPLLLGKMRKQLPLAYYGLLYTNTCKDRKKYSALNIVISCMGLNFIARPDFIAYNHKYRKSLVVKITTCLFRAPKFVWTVKGEEAIKKAHELGEHPIFERR